MPDDSDRRTTGATLFSFSLGAILAILAALVVAPYVIYTQCRIDVPAKHIAVLTRKTGEDIGNHEEVAPAATDNNYKKGLQLEVLALIGHTSHASPSPSLSKSACFPPSIGRTGLNTVGQLSIASGIPSPSASPASGLPV